MRLWSPKQSDSNQQERSGKNITVTYCYGMNIQNIHDRSMSNQPMSRIWTEPSPHMSSVADRTVCCFSSDGSQMEGNTSEAARMAVAQKLEVKLFVAWPEKVFAWCLLACSWYLLRCCLSVFFFFVFFCSVLDWLVSLFVCADCLFLQSCSLHDLCSQWLILGFLNVYQGWSTHPRDMCYINYQPSAE